MVATAPHNIGILRLKPALLFQISIHNWCQAVPLVNSVLSLEKELNTSDLALTPRRRKTRLQQIEFSLELLVGKHPEQVVWERGTPPILPRLKESVWRLLENKRYVMETTLALYNTIDLAEHSAKGCLKEECLNTASEKMALALEKTGISLMEALSLFRDDENVLLYLIRNAETIDQATTFSSKIPKIANSLKLLFPKGAESLEAQLRKRFLRRGFPEVIPIIEEALTRLENPCLINRSAN